MFRRDEIFLDRRDAGRELAQALLPLSVPEPLILALPRGGVPVAFEIARTLQAPLDLLLVRKIGAPYQQEYAVGAVVDGADPQVVLNDEAIAELSLPVDYIETETARQLAEIERRRLAYFADRQPISTKNRNIILVDDGVATGSTAMAGLKALRKAGATSIILAVPVASTQAIEQLEPLADHLTCLHQPASFNAVGLYYKNFEQTSDEEVVSLLAQAAK